ncbi:hypothetical protein LSAT2_032852, partial [Lamellibrachia satsuma]
LLYSKAVFRRRLFQSCTCIICQGLETPIQKPTINEQIKSMLNTFYNIIISTLTYMQEAAGHW